MKRILIIFPYGHLAYSPTILNLCKLLSARGHPVRVVYGFEEYWGKKTPRLDGVVLENISYSTRTALLARRFNRFVWKPTSMVLRALSLFPAYNRLSFREILFSSIIKRTLRADAFDELIAVDILPLYWAQQFKYDCHFVSLEVDDGLQLLSSIDTRRIKSVVIQSQERLRRLFGNSEVRRFLVPNAPNFVEPVRRTKASSNLIYNGAVWAPFGATDMIEFVKAYPEYRIHFKGGIHPHIRGLLDSRYKPLVDSGAISFSEAYMEDDDLRQYLANYSIGFCMYDFNDPDIVRRRFNYETAPSGKVYFYLSVGMPVIATRIRGFGFIEERHAGLLLDDHKPATIKKAVDRILSDYRMFSDNALSLGRSFSFDESAKPFIDLISQ